MIGGRVSITLNEMITGSETLFAKSMALNSSTTFLVLPQSVSADALSLAKARLYGIFATMTKFPLLSVATVPPAVLYHWLNSPTMLLPSHPVVLDIPGVTMTGGMVSCPASFPKNRIGTSSRRITFSWVGSILIFNAIYKRIYSILYGFTQVWSQNSIRLKQKLSALFYFNFGIFSIIYLESY